MIYPDSFEKKIGFATVRDMVANYCTSTLGKEYCHNMAFSTDFDTVKRLLTSTSEMKTIIAGDETLPLENIHDVNALLKNLRVPGTFIPAPDLLHIRQSLSTIAGISTFFAHHRNEDGISPYPVLNQLSLTLFAFPYIVSTIDRVVDRFGNVKDNASPELAEVRRALSAMTGTINAAMRQDSETNAINSYCMLHFIYRLNIFGDGQNAFRGGPRGGEGGGFGGGFGGGGRF